MKKIEFYLTENEYNLLFNKYSMADCEFVKDYIYSVLKQHNIVTNV